MPEVDPNSIPFVPPTEVTMVTKEGKQTTALHDWFTGLWSWMKNSVVDLTTKITTLTATVGDLSASIVEGATIRETEDGILASRITTVEASSSANSAAIMSEQSARISGDSALAAQITTVEAKANSATASGQIYFAAKAGPSGSVAAYGMYLTAGSSYAGLEALALSGGGSAIGFTADKFRFTDSGTAVPVLTYSGGKFTFTGDVAINGSLVINGTVSEDQLALYSATRRSSAFWAGTYETEGWYTHYFTATAGSTVLVMAASSSGAPVPTAFARALGFTDEIEVPVNASALIVRAYVISTTGIHHVQIMSRGTNAVSTADLFVNVIVIQR